MYSGKDLSAITGVSVRTILYYVKMGVISPALPRRERDNPYKGYTQAHLQQLREVQSILDRNMTLEDIRDYLHPQEDEDE